jgi:hypothetical protein
MSTVRNRYQGTIGEEKIVLACDVVTFKVCKSKMAISLNVVTSHVV